MSCLYIGWWSFNCLLQPGLNAAAAEASWNKLFGSADIRKDQVDACGEDGRPLGKARQNDKS